MDVLKILLPFYANLFSIFIPIGIAALVLYGILFIIKINDYRNSSYYKATGIPYFTMRADTGRYGEYLTYKYLKQYENLGAEFLFNVYIPKKDGETSEIDVLMLSPRGIFVFESKNYSGWIFGSETQRNWYQTLPRGRGRSRKESFYNPIMQNRSHIKHLKAFIGERFPMRSIIVFSERCTLKSITLNSDDIKVIKRNEVSGTVNGIYNGTTEVALSAEEIDVLYEKLYPLTQVSDSVKSQHIENINNKHMENTADIAPDTEVISEIDEDLTNDFDTVGTEERDAESAGTDTDDTSSAEPLKCPRCGGELILRTASRGANAGRQFYGCSNFPKCRYVQSL